MRITSPPRAPFVQEIARNRSSFSSPEGIINDSMKFTWMRNYRFGSFNIRAYKSHEMRFLSQVSNCNDLFQLSSLAISDTRKWLWETVTVLGGRNDVEPTLYYIPYTAVVKVSPIPSVSPTHSDIFKNNIPSR